MPELAFREGIMDQIRLREPRFHEHAYLFVLSALEFSQSRLPERRHITGRELAESCRDLALDRYGVMARLVLDHWGVRSTADIGDVVFTLVDMGLKSSGPKVVAALAAIGSARRPTLVSISSTCSASTRRSSAIIRGGAPGRRSHSRSRKGHAANPLLHAA